ncbi:unnamed protein product [Arabidopsis halleri]
MCGCRMCLLEGIWWCMRRGLKQLIWPSPKCTYLFSQTYCENSTVKRA